jgi:hypothetical protein
MEVLMPLQATSGAASYDAFGGGAAAVPQYIEDVFSTWLYTGTGAAQTINNGIDLAGEGGLTWIKARTQPTFASNHALFDTSRGAGKYLLSDAASAEASSIDTLSSFNSNGFSLGADTSVGIVNWPTHTYASWTFRKQPKFFDVVTYTGTGSAQNIAHNLGSVPGAIFIKRTSDVEDWLVYHRSTGNQAGTGLNETAATYTGVTAYWNSTTPTDSVFTVNTHPRVNTSGQTYVAYLFAHNAGGFGLTGTDNVISCGSFTTNGSGAATVDLGYEPQWILTKSTGTSGWNLYDTMRGWAQLSDNILRPNTSAAEISANVANGDFTPTATGFSSNSVNVLDASTTYIYIAIRRGPMKVPTDGTSVFAPVVSAAGGGTITTGFVTDSSWSAIRAGNSNISQVASRLTGWQPYLRTASTGAEQNAGFDKFKADSNTGFTDTLWSGSGSSIYWNFRRAPGFMDVCCYTGTGSARTVTHNLTVVPEMMIVKSRSNTTQWRVYSAANGNTKSMRLNSDEAAGVNPFAWNNTSPTSTVFTVGDDAGTNATNYTYVAYLFATCPGVSKVFSYTGNGSSQTINCGFTGGARFVMVKRTDSTGNWLVVDTARGLVSAGDPTLYLNSTAAEVTGADWIDPDSSGFIVNQEGTMNANVSSATYIGFAVA